MFIRRLFTCILFVIPFIVSAQTSFRDYSVSDLSNAAQYGTGVRQSNAQNELAIRYESGVRGVKKDYGKAIYWYTQSSNNGNQYAMYNLANMYLYGRGVNRDISQALHWMELSARKYLLEASLSIGKWYYFGEYVEQDYFKASQYLKDAAFGGSSDAMYLFAWMYAFGQGVTSDYDRAIFWANRAVNNGNSGGYQVIGNMYKYGKTTPIDLSYARHYYELGIEMGNLPCMEELADIYLNETNDDYDFDKGYSLLEKAANLGSTSAMLKLGDLNFYLQYGLDDVTAAAKWYHKAFDSGGINEQYYDRLLLIYYNRENYNSILRLYLSRIESGKVTAEDYNGLSYLYAEGKGVEKDLSKAVIYIDEAISMAPDEANYQDSKGEVLLLKGDVKGATRIWKKINSDFPLFYQQYVKEHNGETTNLDQYMKSNQSNHK